MSGQAAQAAEREADGQGREARASGLDDRKWQALTRDRRLLFACCGAAAFLGLALPWLTGLSVAWASFVPVVQLCAVLALFWPYAEWRGLHRITVAIECVAAGLLLTVPVLIISYAAMRAGFPLADAELDALDRAFGFHWPSFVAWVDARPGLSRLLAEGYSSFALQLLVIPALLAFTGQFARAYRFVFAYFLLCAISCAIAVGFPSIGTYAYYGVAKAELASINAHFGYFFLESFEGARADPDFVLSLDNASGIITFPSIHAAVAVLCGWAVWRLKLIRWPVIALNVAMFVSAISHGAHYMIDLPAGALVTAATLVVARRLFGPDQVAGAPPPRAAACSGAAAAAAPAAG